MPDIGALMIRVGCGGTSSSYGTCNATAHRGSRAQLVWFIFIYPFMPSAFTVMPFLASGTPLETELWSSFYVYSLVGLWLAT